jgi:hypothetical protein
LEEAVLHTSLEMKLRRLLLGLLLLIPGACSSSRSTWFERKSSRDYLDMALESERPDERRRGVEGLAGGNDATAEWAIDVFDTIARSDTDAMVRVAAIRGMKPSMGSHRVPTLLKILQCEDASLPDCRRAPAPVRWEAARLLHQIVEYYAYEDSQQGDIVMTLVDRLRKDGARRVRLTAIDTLGYFAQRPVPEALVDAMEEDDFAIRHAAELAMQGMTGQSHDHDPIAWREWLASVDDPFAALDAE